MRILLLVACCLAPVLAQAKVLNVEFKFTPFTGDLKDDHVEVVPGTARVFVNNLPVAKRDLEKQSLPVLFDEREVGPAVWVPVESLGGVVRKGENTIRIEFDPTDTKATYRIQLRWASVMDQTKEEDADGRHKATNQDDEGAIDKDATGTVSLERKFVATDFAKDRPWHHYPAVTAVSPEDQQQLAAAVKSQADAFKPDFSALYTLLGTLPDVKVGELKKLKCFDKAYAAGVRVPAPPADQLEFVTTGNPEVVVRRKGGDLFTFDPAQFRKIKGDEIQMCAGMVLSMLYPPQLVFVRQPDGAWAIPH